MEMDRPCDEPIRLRPKRAMVLSPMVTVTPADVASSHGTVWRSQMKASAHNPWGFSITLVIHRESCSSTIAKTAKCRGAVEFLDLAGLCDRIHGTPQRLKPM